MNTGHPSLRAVCSLFFSIPARTVKLLPQVDLSNSFFSRSATSTTVRRSILSPFSPCPRATDSHVSSVYAFLERHTVVKFTAPIAAIPRSARVSNGARATLPFRSWRQRVCTELKVSLNVVKKWEIGVCSNGQ